MCRKAPVQFSGEGATATSFPLPDLHSPYLCRCSDASFLGGAAYFCSVYSGNGGRMPAAPRLLRREQASLAGDGHRIGDRPDAQFASDVLGVFLDRFRFAFQALGDVFVPETLGEVN